MINVVKHNQYCGSCDIIETCGKHVQYVKCVISINKTVYIMVNNVKFEQFSVEEIVKYFVQRNGEHFLFFYGKFTQNIV